ncbi:putative high-affinity cgmp-specific 3,5-cyclic phosphodiesterase [Schistosoma mansoni]|uniref:putative high-affinity cgmp-specific 3,5-cyclic phosphodiesterase n=1 Tax=Schistosoma mansoni TaxID=6183 RepID=UPI00022DC175|nr:putative high-affinity cgmp-specific 3,5-cyclic phosphodiesterase [Schistosoma mansoni]|eukprot:XP_018650510.1 putative high-affinity cgmp-specific 3,5-cyclic phosphodiesterase [Schistosoma mansoni]
MSVSNCSNQFNSISVDPDKKDNHKIDAQNTSVHINKRQTADKFHSNTTEYQSKSNMTTTVMTSIPTTTTIEPINVHKKINPSLMIADNSAYFNDNHENLLEISKLPIYDSTKLCIKCQKNIQLSFSYLSWLGLTAEQPPTQKVLVPGFNAPAPNPQMHLIRRSDADSRRNIQEFKLLCKEPVSKEDLIELRSSTFNNWSRTDAQLIRLVREMFQELGFIEHYNIQLHQLDLWLTDIYRRYNRVPFHNYKHAFMVTQMCYVLIWGGNLTNLLDIDDQLILIVSAICHDLDHPGFNNAYQINAGTVLAMRYNDQSPLENHHTAVAFDLLSHKEVDPFSHLSTTTRQRIRKGVIRCILATDMSRHNEILDEFNRQVLTDLNAAWEIDPNTKKPTWVMNKTQKDLVMVIILKISDISNEARPLNVAGPWINRLLAEFFHQSDYEKLVGLPVAPFMDRHKVTKSASQCGFIRFVILPLFESLAKLLPEVKVSFVYRIKK